MGFQLTRRIGKVQIAIYFLKFGFLLLDQNEAELRHGLYYKKMFHTSKKIFLNPNFDMYITLMHDWFKIIWKTGVKLQ